MSTKHVENVVRLFGMTALQAHDRLTEVEKEIGIDLDLAPGNSDDQDEDYYPQFKAGIRAEAQKMSVHYEVFYCLERSIRELITEKFISVKGADWWKQCVPEDVKANALRAQTEEVNSGVTPRSQDLLDYTTFGELSKIINGNWDVFGDMFSSQQAVQRVMNNLNILRGPIAHCSILAEDEVLRLKISVKAWFRLME